MVFTILYAICDHQYPILMVIDHRNDSFESSYQLWHWCIRTPKNVVNCIILICGTAYSLIGCGINKTLPFQNVKLYFLSVITILLIYYASGICAFKKAIEILSFFHVKFSPSQIKRKLNRKRTYYHKVNICSFITPLLILIIILYRTFPIFYFTFYEYHNSLCLI